jgi:hypothetical protein
MGVANHPFGVTNCLKNLEGDSVTLFSWLAKEVIYKFFIFNLPQNGYLRNYT